jgi:hypothetical protein
MPNADVRATRFHDHHHRAHGATAPSASHHEPGGTSPAVSEREEERVCVESFWIDLGGEG